MAKNIIVTGGADKWGQRTRVLSLGNFCGRRRQPLIRLHLAFSRSRSKHFRWNHFWNAPGEARVTANAI